MCVTFLMRFVIFLHLEGQRWIVKSAPFMIHPRISLEKAHVPSPSCSLRWETGSSPLWVDISGGEDGVDAVDDGVREVLKVGAVEVVRAGYEVIDKNFQNVGGVGRSVEAV